MKSLLVDALRRAEGTEPQEAEPSDVSTDDGNSDAKAESVELNLMHTGAFPRATSGDVEPTLAKELEALDVPGPSATYPFAKETAVQGSCEPGQPIRKPLFARVAMLTPVLCLLALSAAAAGYLLVNRLSFNSLNEDLTEIAHRPRMDLAAEATDPEWRSLPATHINVFDRNVLRDAALPQASTTAAVSTVNDDAKAPSDSGVNPLSRETAGSSLVSGANAAFHDAAFGKVQEAYAAYRSGDYAKAELLYGQALTIEPNHKDALVGVAAVYQLTGQKTQALDAYRKLLSIDAGNALAASAILTLRSAEQGWESESDLKHLLQRYPEAHYLHFALGSVYISKARWPEARQAFAKASALSPDDAEYRFNLAVSLEHLGELSSAREHYKLALAGAESSLRIDRQALAAHIAALSVEAS